MAGKRKHHARIAPLDGTSAEHREEVGRLAQLADTVSWEFERAMRANDCATAYAAHIRYERLAARLQSNAAETSRGGNVSYQARRTHDQQAQMFTRFGARCIKK